MGNKGFKVTITWQLLKTTIRGMQCALGNSPIILFYNLVKREKYRILVQSENLSGRF